ncbi:MAG: hypothetical protein U0M15_07125 [Bacillota bacterium]|nr:hypothetical protein [Bacillota bacterium]
MAYVTDGGARERDAVTVDDRGRIFRYYGGKIYMKSRAMERGRMMKMIKKGFVWVLALLLVAMSGCGANQEKHEEVKTESTAVAWGLEQEDFFFQGMRLGTTTAQEAEALLGDAVTATYEEMDEAAGGAMPSQQYIVEAGDSCYYFGTFDNTLEREQWYLFMVESTAMDAVGPRGISVGDSLEAVKAKFPQEGRDGETLYRVTVPVQQDDTYDITELYEATEVKDEFFHYISFGCGYENSEWFAQYTVTLEDNKVTGFHLYAL